MSRPRIRQTDGQIGFHWETPDGCAISLPDLARLDDEPERLVPTHLEALDDVLIDAAGRWGEILGGGRAAVDATDQRDLRELHRVLDRLNHEYAVTAQATGVEVDVRGGQIVGTSALIGSRARMALGETGPTPFGGELDDPRIGVLAGLGQFQQVDPAQPWRGGRWVLRAQDGKRYPLTLAMLLFDSSGVNKDAALEEHRVALTDLAALVDLPASGADESADPFVLAGALDHLLHDWLMAHRDAGDSGAIEIRKDRSADARMIVAAANAGAATRARIDPALFRIVVPVRADRSARAIGDDQAWCGAS